MVQNLFSVLIFQLLVAASTLVGAQHLQLSELASDGMLEVAGSIQAVDAERKQWDLLLDAKSPHFAQRSVRVRVRSGDFALYNQRGLVTQSSNLQGGYVVMNFIFTRCMVARMCPLSTQKMRTLAGLLSKASDLPVRLLSVTLDPEYDTPGVFEEYARAYDFPAGSIDFLTGPEQAVSDLKAQLGVLAKADDKLIINHTMMVIVADPLGKISYQVPGSAWSPEAVFEHIQQQHAAAQDAKADS